jgi:hypothetical protein
MVKFLKRKKKKCYGPPSSITKRLRQNNTSRKDYTKDSNWLTGIDKKARKNVDLLFGRTNSLFEHNDDNLIQIIRNAGLFNFLITEAGGSNDPVNALLTCKRLASYVIWIVNKKQEAWNNSEVDYLNHDDVSRTVLDLLLRNPQYIGEYIVDLTARNATPSTKLNILNHLKKCALWAMLSSPFNLTYELHCFEKICKNIGRSCKRQNVLRIQNRGNLDYLLKNGRWPKGGYMELINLVLSSCKFIDDLAVTVRNDIFLKKSDYCRLLRILVALLYLTSHQGRPNAINNLTYLYIYNEISIF